MILVVQHIWSRWTKAARAAAAHRPRPREAYPLPGAVLAAPTLVHELTLHEADGFALKERFGAADGAMAGALRWKPQADGFALTQTAPMQGLRATPWPGHLPSPLIVLGPGESAVIDWNGRFRASMGGSNRSYFFEQHRIGAAVVEVVEPDLFTTLKPKKAFDFTTRIY